MTSASSAPILCNHSCDRDTMVVQCRLHQLNLRYSSGRLFTIVVVCLMIVVLSAPPLLPINLMHQSSSHQSTLMIASTPSPCDSGVIYNQIFNLLPRRPNLVSVYLKHNALHKIWDTYRVFIHIEHLTCPARGTSTAILWIDYDMGGSKSNKLSLVGYVTWLLYIYFGITKHTTMQKKRVCLSWHVRIAL